MGSVLGLDNDWDEECIGLVFSGCNFYFTIYLCIDSGFHFYILFSS